MKIRNFAIAAIVLSSISGELGTSDGVAISYDQYKRGSDTVIVVCPGFYNSKSNRWMRETVDIVASKYDAIIFDFRGHGKSGGKYTWSAKEDLDVDAVLDYAKAQGYKHIGVVAFSLGAAAAVNAAAARDSVDSMVLISCPSSFRMVDFHFWEPAMLSDLFDNIGSKWQGKGAKADNIFIPKKDPIDNIGALKHTAVLFIHGDTDWVVKDRHSKKLYAAARQPKRLEIIKGGLHAERLIQADPEGMKALILGWFSDTIQ
jgi:pimeloyl-ACP methyl ester carboxylesterase